MADIQVISRTQRIVVNHPMESRTVVNAGPQGPPGLAGPASTVPGPTGPAGATGPAGPSSVANAISGLWMPLFPFSGTGTQNCGQGLCRVTRAIIQVPVSSWQMEVTVAVAGAIFRIGIYADTPTGPGALLYQSGDIDGGTVGNKTVTFSVPAGTYWIALQNVGGAGNPTLRSSTGANPWLPGVDQPGNNNLPNGWQAPGSGTTLKDPFPMGSIARTGAMYALFWQAM